MPRGRTPKRDVQAGGRGTVCATCGDEYETPTDGNGILLERCQCGTRTLTPLMSPPEPPKGWFPLGHR